jgi:hypothetical protein
MGRDVELEKRAVAELGYTMDQVKRKTMAQLTTELAAAADSADDASKHEKSPEDAPHRRKKAVTFSPEARGERSDAVALDTIYQIHQTLRAKQKFTAQLERDPDFSARDLEEWHASIGRTSDRLNKALESAGGEDLRARWERRAAKVREMDRLGLLDEELLAVWMQKQKLLERICRDAEQ